MALPKTVVYLYGIGMPALCRRLNYRNIGLHADTAGETVGVRLANGRARQVRWLGFVTLDEAKGMRARPVKIGVARYSDTGFDWIDLRPDQYAQGALITEGVYAVTTASVRIVCINRKPTFE